MTTIKEQLSYIHITLLETIKILIKNAKDLEIVGKKFRN